MIDKGFWSGAILVVTIVVAGASSLPALLLRPMAPDPARIPVAAPPAAAVKQIAEPIPPRVEPPPVSPVAAATPAPQPAATMPQPPPAAPVRATAPIAFPPVQPVGVAAANGPDAVAAPAAVATARLSRAIDKPRQRTAHGKVTRKRYVRPAVFPLREFLAWRR